MTIAPIGLRSESPRQHSIHMILDLLPGADKHSERTHVAAIATEALTAIALDPRAMDARRVTDVLATRRIKQGGTPVNSRIVIGIEASTVSFGRPPAGEVAVLRQVLERDGYRVIVRETRECAERGCNTLATVEWEHSSEIPPRWHSVTTCGAHNLRVCPQCKSVYSLSSVNAAGQAPSLHCEVCGRVLVEWGASKIWTATLLRKADGTGP